MMNIINLININVLVLMFQGSRSHASGPGHEDVEAIQCLILQPPAVGPDGSLPEG
jgi:hypothetical protein